MSRILENEETENISEKVYRENNNVYFYAEITRETISKLNVLLREAEEYCILTSYKLKIEFFLNKNYYFMEL